MADTAERELDSQFVDNVVIRFAGDSGDGMQLTGDRFTSVSAALGNDLSTLPEYPAEIRAPAGTIAGVSAFQVHISDHEITTPGDAPDVLVAMNPAGLLSQLDRMLPGGTVIMNSDAFTERNIAKAGYEGDPLEDDRLDQLTVIQVPMTSMTKECVKDLGVKPRDAERSKNFFALGLVSWLYTRPTQPTFDWIENKFAGKELVIAANQAAFRAGHAFGETAELADHRYEVRPAKMAAGTYTQINGNIATAWGLVAASELSGLPLFLGSYPITPASDILHELSKHKNFGVRTLQCEDEIAAVGAALGASYGGHLAVTTTSGPGLALKTEMIGLALMTELPMVIVNVQRGGPSTGLPTKPEQSDLMQAMYGRHGESAIPVVAASSPSDCFDAAIEAARIAISYRTPVLLLTDGFLANGTEPWLLPDVASLAKIDPDFLTTFNAVDENGEPVLMSFARDPETLARPWIKPGTPGLTHRIGGLEKADGSGNVNYDYDNHERMTHLRAEKIAGISVAKATIEADATAETVVVGWGSTWGAIDAAIAIAGKTGFKAAHIHLRHINPFPANLGELLGGFKNVLVPEMNMGQLSRLIRAEYLVDAVSISNVRGQPFNAHVLARRISDEVGGKQ